MIDHELRARPLHEVPFCVIDVETSGTDASCHRITELGVARYVGGERVATLGTLVGDVHCREPDMAELAPTLLELLRGSVIVGHNVGFDLRFLNAVLDVTGHDALDPADAVDTLLLARRLVADDADDCRLATLATRFDLPHRPTHRALDDVLATGDLLHLLLERAAGFGVATLDDLVELPRLAAHRYAHKLRLTASLPRQPGTLVCHGPRGEVLLRIDADDVRRAARGLFAGTDRRRVDPVLRVVARFGHASRRVCA